MTPWWVRRAEIWIGGALIITLVGSEDWCYRRWAERYRSAGKMVFVR